MQPTCRIQAGVRILTEVAHPQSFGIPPHAARLCILLCQHEIKPITNSTTYISRIPSKHKE